MVSTDKFVKINVSVKEGRHVSDTIVDWRSDVKTEGNHKQKFPFLSEYQNILCQVNNGWNQRKKFVGQWS